MPRTIRHRLDKPRRYTGQRAGQALIAWLNSPHSEKSWLYDERWKHKILEELLQDASEVFRYLLKYRTHHEFYVASKAGKSAKRFREHYERLNKRLLSFTHAPLIELNEFYEGNPITWNVAEDSPVAPLGSQIGWFIELIKQGVILKIRRCQQCGKWYFARFSHQEFCNGLCRAKHHAGTEAFKERRRKYMRDYYRLKKSGKVK
jgi:hypothetical protein